MNIIITNHFVYVYIFINIVIFLLMYIKLLNLKYDYAFVTTLPPVDIINIQIFKIVLINLVSLAKQNGGIVIFSHYISINYNISCNKCIFLKITKYN